MVAIWELAVGEYYVAGKSEYQIQEINVEKDYLAYIESPRGGYVRGVTSIQEFANRMDRVGKQP